jgi:hypothetical protein
MGAHPSKTLGLVLLLLLAFSLEFPAPARAQQTITLAQPIWVTVNASAQGNYPGGDELFTVFAVNSAQTPTENIRIDNMTLKAPFQTNFGPGLPVILVPGASVLVTIHLEIPSNFAQNNFTANLVVHAGIWNGTGYNQISVTGSAPVNVFFLTPSQQTSSQSTTTTQSTAQGGTVSTTLFAAGVAVPSIVAVILLILLVQKRSSPRG